MSVRFVLLSTVVSLALTACGAPGTKTYTPTTRAAGLDTLSFQSLSQDEARLRAQADALTDMGARLQRSATGKGLALGTAAGCATVLIDPSNITGCAVGAAIGATAGHVRGKRAVERRVEIVSANDMVRAIRPMNDTMSELQADLPALLAAQDAELTQLAVVGGPAYDKRFAEVREMRVALAEALSLTERQARAAEATLEAAEAQGQTGLDYHRAAVAELARDSGSARSRITLL